MSIYTTLFQMEQEKESIIKEMKERIRKQDEKIDQYGKMVENYSTFNDEDIIDIMTRLISTYECEEYIPITINKKDADNKESTNNLGKTLVIVARASLDELEKYRPAILFSGSRAVILSENYVQGNQLRFFGYNSQSKGFHLERKMMVYTYIIDFIEEVVNYRIENNVENIDKSVLESLMESFIIRNQTVIDEEQARKAMLNQQMSSAKASPSKN